MRAARSRVLGFWRCCILGHPAVCLFALWWSSTLDSRVHCCFPVSGPVFRRLFASVACQCMEDSRESDIFANELSAKDVKLRLAQATEELNRARAFSLPEEAELEEEIDELSQLLEEKEMEDRRFAKEERMRKNAYLQDALDFAEELGLDSDDVFGIPEDAQVEADDYMDGPSAATLKDALGLTDMTADEIQWFGDRLNVPWSEERWSDLFGELGEEGRGQLSDLVGQRVPETDAMRKNRLDNYEWSTLVEQVGDPALPKQEWNNLGQFLGMELKRSWAHAALLVLVVRRRKGDGGTFMGIKLPFL
eukprot:TRINITY_DN88542_c0_g1_i1.p1 TRINITY_DN88542_c0_g1~~TRINITY_DN88542_c0_g1_i1.p1  ORF type:complete len:306 (+),score=52.17 TRINITY_DN88542_c0_g1_i1:61-978(+)